MRGGKGRLRTWKGRMRGRKGGEAKGIEEKSHIAQGENEGGRGKHVCETLRQGLRNTLVTLNLMMDFGR